MQFLLLGLLALTLFLLASRYYTMANPQALARQIRIGAGVAALAGAGILVVRGMLGYAMSLAAVGSWGRPRAWQPSISRSSSITTPARCVAACSRGRLPGAISRT